MHLSQSDTPRVTHHFDLRWVSRTKDFTIDSLLTAWEESEPVDLQTRDCTEARWNKDHDVLLLAQDNAITTVLYAESEEFEPVHPKQRCNHCGQTTRAPATAECEWCQTTGEWTRLSE